MYKKLIFKYFIFCSSYNRTRKEMSETTISDKQVTTTTTTTTTMTTTTTAVTQVTAVSSVSATSSAPDEAAGAIPVFRTYEKLATMTDRQVQILGWVRKMRTAGKITFIELGSGF